MAVEKAVRDVYFWFIVEIKNLQSKETHHFSSELIFGVFTFSKQFLQNFD